MTHFQLPSDWTKPISYYIDTTDLKPFAKYHYQMVVKTRGDFESFRGYIKITPIGDKRDSEQIKIEPGTIKPNSTYTHLIKVPKNLGIITKALGRINKEKLDRLVNTVLGRDMLEPTQVIKELQFNFMSNEDQKYVMFVWNMAKI